METKNKYTLEDLQNEFPNDKVIAAYLFRKRFPMARCSKCHRFNQFYQGNTNPNKFTCACGRNNIFVLKGTILGRSHCSLVDWFRVMYLFMNSKSLLTAQELERHVHLSYKAVFRMLTLIRKLIHQKTNYTTSMNNATIRKILNKKYHTISERKMPEYISSYKFRQEKWKRSKNPFFILLDMVTMRPSEKIVQI